MTSTEDESCFHKLWYNRKSFRGQQKNKKEVKTMSHETVVRHIKRIMDVKRAWDPWDPSDYSTLKDVIDIHLHVNPGRGSALAIAKEATRVGMKAIVYKGIQAPSVHVASLCEEAIREWAKERGLRPVRVFGGPVLDKHAVGGLNVKLVKAMIQWGAKKIWMPVHSAVNHLKQIGMPSEVVNQGIYILKNGELLPEVNEIIAAVAEADVALSGGHLSPEEHLALIDRASKAGVKKIIVDHPHESIMGPTTFEQRKEMVKRGAYLNVIINPGFYGLDPYKIMEDIQKIGVEHCTLSTDAGMTWQASPTESMRSNIDLLKFCGMSAEELDIMTKKNPAKILGLDN
jgi:hypothetical protein